MAIGNLSQGQASPEPLERAPIRIVIADDQPIFRRGLRQLLSQEADFEILAETADEDELLRVLERKEPDILLLELKMAGLNGLGLLQRLRAQRLKTKVIVLTVSEDEEEYVQAMRFGAVGILRKRTATELLIKCLRKVHLGEIWLDLRTTAAVLRQFAAQGEPAPKERDRTQLTRREREIVNLVAQGCTNKEIAERIFISEQTVKNHLHNIFDKLGFNDRLQLALYVMQQSEQPS